jgi:6-phosphofructokinase 1
MIVEVFGRYAGHTAFRGGLAADADCILIPEVPADFDVVYAHMKKVYLRRIRESDVCAGTYMIVVAEGLQDAKGEAITDKGAGADAFGHKKLAGAGKYVRQQIDERMKKDPEIKAFMQETGQYVPELNEIPEAREVVPTHLVRSGFSSAFDVNFGKEAGAAAVRLLAQGITGVTVAGVTRGEITYMKTKDAIVQRHVDLASLALFEQLGVCFGRPAAAFSPRFHEERRMGGRYL